MKGGGGESSRKQVKGEKDFISHEIFIQLLLAFMLKKTILLNRGIIPGIPPPPLLRWIAQSTESSQIKYTNCE